jgi:hypothetical protein
MHYKCKVKVVQEEAEAEWVFRNVLCSQLRELTYADISSKYSVKNIQ